MNTRPITLSFACVMFAVFALVGGPPQARAHPGGIHWGDKVWYFSANTLVFDKGSGFGDAWNLGGQREYYNTDPNIGNIPRLDAGECENRPNPCVRWSEGHWPGQSWAFHIDRVGVCGTTDCGKVELNLSTINRDPHWVCKSIWILFGAHETTGYPNSCSADSDAGLENRLTLDPENCLTLAFSGLGPCNSTGRVAGSDIRVRNGDLYLYR